MLASRQFKISSVVKNKINFSQTNKGCREFKQQQQENNR